ncbi:MAG: hypothetical protein PHI23_05355 [Candidatus Peribacteraceae bacterium]|nr:hypothetical protein [Candidatus Peribacteraceae bacterium]
MPPSKNRNLEQGCQRLIAAIGAVEAVEQYKGAPPSPKQLQSTREALRKALSTLLLPTGTAVDAAKGKPNADPSAEALFQVLRDLSDSVVAWDQAGQQFHPAILGQYRGRLAQLCASPSKKKEPVREE